MGLGGLSPFLLRPRSSPPPHPAPSPGAVRLCPGAAKAVFASHVSAEPAGRAVLDALGKQPLITAGMRLGEGTGAVASIPLWDMARAVYAESYSFAQCGVEAYQPQGG